MTLPQGPSDIHKSLKPKGGSELKIWNREEKRGWELGVRQADSLFAANVATLSRDYLGLMIFKRLTLERYARSAGLSESLTDLEVKESEIVFKKTLHRLVGRDGFKDPR
jgi:defect-in-organelle-trafficking protein DotC